MFREMTVIAPVVTIDRYDATEVSFWFNEAGVSGVIVQEPLHPDVEVALKGKTTEEKHILLQSFQAAMLKRNVGRPYNPTPFCNQIQIDDDRLKELGQSAPVMNVFDVDAKLLMHVDMPEASGLLFHRNYAEQGMLIMSPKTRTEIDARELRRNLVLDADKVRAMLHWGDANIIQLKPGDSVYFNGKMGHQTNPNPGIKIRTFQMARKILNMAPSVA